MASYTSEFIMEQAKSSISLSVCQCGWQQSEPGHSYGPMVRDYYVIHYIVKGKGHYVAGGKTYNLQKGNGFLLPPGETTFYQADQDEPWEYYWVGFVGNEAERLLRLAGLGPDNLIFNYSQEDDDTLEKHIADIYYASQEYEDRSLAMIGYLYLFFALLVKRTNSTGIYHQKYLNKAIAYIEENYMHPITVQDIAAHIGIDRSYLYRVFRHVLDVSIKEYIDSLRLSKAKEILCSTGMSVSEVCVAVGFRDGSHFSKKFRAAFGVSPSAYRKSQE